jgi:hypothetical protein
LFYRASLKKPSSLERGEGLSGDKWGKTQT